MNSSAPAETKRRINIETPYGNVTCAHVSLCSINLLVGIATRILLSPSADIYAAEETVKAILTDTSICSQRRSCNASSQSAEDGCHDYADQAGRELASSLCPSELWHICEPAVPCYEIRNESHNYIGLYSYGLCSYGLCSYGLYSHGLYSYGLYEIRNESQAYLIGEPEYAYCAHMYGLCDGCFPDIAAWLRALTLRRGFIRPWDLRRDLFKFQGEVAAAGDADDRANGRIERGGGEYFVASTASTQCIARGHSAIMSLRECEEAGRALFF